MMLHRNSILFRGMMAMMAAALGSGCTSISGEGINQVHFNAHASLTPPPDSNPLAATPAGPSRQQQIQREAVEARAGLNG